ncbi:hypothetical protein RJD39_14775 [Vibrio scophthalmi]|uniref:hypothetical protein n=1 Tax=Vibrio scophthalmi TaxID=45658 RepID=UPI003872CAD8
MTDATMELESKLIEEVKQDDEELSEEQKDALENKKFAEMIQEIHLFDLNEDGSYKESDADLKDKPDLSTFLVRLCPEESPNDFDKNHKFKVDAHLVM